MIVDLHELLTWARDAERMEVRLPLPCGRELRAAGGTPGQPIVAADYVRVLSSEGVELLRFTPEEIAERPHETLGSLIGCMLGLGGVS